MLNRNEHMGGRPEEIKALQDLEDLRLQLIDRCKYLNEKNWVASVSCLNRISLSKILFYDRVIEMIIDVPGVVIELGVQWGALTSLLYNLSAIREPFNFKRRTIGFDTFTGFPSASLSGKEAEQGWKAHDLAGSADSKLISERCLDAHQVFSAMSHMLRHELIQGDVTETLPEWFENNPHETVALCIFDLDLGIPTRKALKHILGRSQKGTVLVFDEYSHPRFPEEGIAVREVIDTMKSQPIKSELLPYTSYVVL